MIRKCTENTEFYGVLSINVRTLQEVPIHYGSVSGSKGDAKVFKKLVDPSVQVKIKL